MRLNRTMHTVNSWIIRYSDLFVAGGVILIIALLVFRIPPVVMDLLIAVNISMAALVLLTSLYIPDARRLPSFPTILLLTTLFRLGLNVSTTRLILLEADAGKIIDTFGEFVVQGNFVVGGVVFLILVIVQFVVIAQGSERIATVAARFTLDAMPGKQSTIEGDIRSGLVTPEEGRIERRALEQESKLYGAMDGAMKFVKGDAIAGIVISIINVIGGLTIGVAQQGMSAGEAAQIYSLLTIGDGLVSQIPALLISVSAGLIVTRVAGQIDDPTQSSNVGSDIVEQVLSQPRSLAMLGVVLVMLAVSAPMTGFPLVPFVLLALAAGALFFVRGFGRRKRKPASMREGGEQDDEAAAAVFARLIDGPARPAMIRLSPSLAAALGADDDPLTPEAAQDRVRTWTRLTPDRLSSLAQEAGKRLGFNLPEVGLALGDDKMAEGSYAIEAYGRVVGRGAVPIGRLLLLEAAAEDESGDLWEVPWGPAGVKVKVVDATGQGAVGALHAAAVVGLHFKTLVERRPDVFFGGPPALQLFESFQTKAPDLVKEITMSQFRRSQVLEVVRGLLREQAPLIDPHQIFEHLARVADVELTTENAVAQVPRRVGAMVADRCVDGNGRMRVYQCDDTLNQELTAMMRDNQGQPRPEVAEVFDRLFPGRPDPDDRAVLLVDESLRSYLLASLRETRSDLMVLAYQDLGATHLVEVEGTLSLGTNSDQTDQQAKSTT